LLNNITSATGALQVEVNSKSTSYRTIESVTSWCVTTTSTSYAR